MNEDEKKARLERAKKIGERFKEIFAEADRNDAPIVRRAFQTWFEHEENQGRSQPE